MADSSLLETGLKAVGLVGAGVGWLYQTRGTLLRGKIKADLEILDKARALFGNDDPRSIRIAAKATLLMSYLYRDAESRTRGRLSWPDLGLAGACFLGAGAFVWRGIFSGASITLWQGALAAILGFVALGALLNAVDQHRKVEDLCDDSGHSRKSGNGVAI